MLEKRQETEHEDRVHLKPLFGVKPGHYLAILYGLVILLVFFFVFLYPGLSRPGSVARVRSEPSGAAFHLDGVYMGTTPCEVFVPRGRHVVQLSLPRFTALQREEEFRGRLFASLFFPLSHPVEGALRPDDPAAAFAFAAADYAAWTFAGEPTASWQIPQSLSEGAYRTGPWLEPAGDRETAAGEGVDTGGGGLDADGILRASARFAVTRAALRDLMRAKFLADNGGLSPSPVTLYRSAAGMLLYLSENPGFAETLAGILPEDAATAFTGSGWYRKQAASPAADSGGPGAGREDPPASTLPAGGEIPAALRIGSLNFIRSSGKGGRSFLIGETAVSKEAFEQFLQARPQWGRDRLPVLIDEGLVNGDYLSPSGDGPVTAVSWHAAAAFCAWLGESLPPSMDSWELRLPTEAEWEDAEGMAEFHEMTGDVWEWCADPFVPLPFLPAPARAIEAVGSPQRPVRGGAWVNTGTAAARGSLPPELCSSFVSFRPVIVPRTGTGKETP
ncbi:MAG: SUMF1/EgtB/PvdO family nonheme iron enzyme [Treponema sp.]|jgi:hypothetical protein|nr:SUMF1/EgtB/PvdO family nonheme iron enzyme [Treponema sp.]